MSEEQTIQMAECAAISGNRHIYDKGNNKRCPFCIEEMKSKSLSAPIEEIKEEKKEPEHPPLCINCHYIATSFDKDFNKFRCLHPDNYAGINLVDGSKVYTFEFCWQLRSGNNRHPQACCDQTGKGFKQRTQPAITHVDYNPPNVTPLGPRKIKLTDHDLDNL